MSRGTDDTTEQSGATGHDALGIVQGTLFGNGTAHTLDDSEVGYQARVAMTAAGITYRQLDYWARTGLVEPTVRDAAGSGNQRLYSFRDMLLLKVVKRLLDAGVSLQNIRAATAYLRQRSAETLADITLMSDGASVYECTNNDEVIDLVRQGQGVFGIAVGQVWRELAGSLTTLPTATAQSAQAPADELAARRARRIS
ncbi:MAG: MerR family transcriptional regulator [Actinomycetales bacterium]|nr:MerR family transcriptional regulator [Actinomycetales bacterium]